MLSLISFTTLVAYQNWDKNHFIDLNHPYLKKFNGIESHKYDSTTDDVWHFVEPQDKRFMVFYSYSSFFGRMESKGIVASTHRHHLARELNNGLELLCPIFNGIDVKTQKDSSFPYYFRCDPFWYMEAR